MAQKFPEVGLRAVFQLTGFQKNYSSYQTMMRDVDRVTKSTAKSINTSMSSAAANVARSGEELVNQSKFLRDILSQLTPEESLRALAQWRAELGGLAKNTKINVDAFDRLASSGINIRDALAAASGQIRFSMEQFERLVGLGYDANQAFQWVAEGATIATGKINILGREFSVTALAVAAVTATLRIGYGVIKDSVEAYDELANATRRVHYQTGLLTAEASTWVNVAEAAGLSTATSERALTSFLEKVTDLRQEQLAGEESTSEFSKAMEYLGITITDSRGGLKTTEQLLREVNDAFVQLGPGVRSTDAAMALFGYSGRFLLPILTDQEQSLADLSEQVERYGASLGAIDMQQFEELRMSQNRLKEASQGLKNEISRGWTEARTNFNNFLADFLNGFRKADAAVRAFFKTFTTVEGQMTPFKDLGRLFQENLQFFLTGETEAARRTEEIAQTYANALQALSAAGEVSLVDDETLRDLDELKTRFNEKLTDIERDAGQRWDDILVQRMRDAMDKARQDIYRIQDLRAALDEQLADIEVDFAKRWDDIIVGRMRDAILRGIRLAWQFEDLLADAERSRQDTLRDFAEREAEMRKDVQKRIQEAEEDARDRREKLERDHQRRLRDIQQEYLDTVQEAARRNDAVEVARAMRERAREMRDEEQRYADEQADLEDALAKKREAIEQDRREREADHRAELARALQRIQENYERQRQQLVENNERERLLRDLQYQWELEDFNKAKAEQIQAAQDAYDKQIAQLQKANDRYNEELAIQYEREREDFQRDRQRRIDDAEFWYAQERDKLAEHLQLTGAQLEAAYEEWAREAAAAASSAVREISDALATEISRYQQYLTDLERAAAQASGAIGGSAAAAARPYTGGYTPMVQGPGGVWGAAPGTPMIGMQEGGVIHATGPTHVLMGEGGPETGVFLPGGSGRLNVNHSFGRLGVDFQGLPGGMNTQQVQSIVYQVMTQLAKSVQVKR